MYVDTPIIPFCITDLSVAQRERLDDLLTKLESLIKERERIVNTAKTQTLKACFNEAAMADTKSRIKYNDDLLTAYNTVDPTRLRKTFTTLAEKLRPHLNDTSEWERFEKIPFAQQKILYSKVVSSYKDYMNSETDKKFWDDLHQIYHRILTRYPTMLYSEEDITGAINLGNILRQTRASLISKWQDTLKAANFDTEKTYQARTDLTRDLLAQAYPDDNAEDLDFGHATFKQCGGIYLGETDTIILDSGKFGQYTWFQALKTLSHEFQHRRQHRLAKQLKNNELTEGSSEHYQARLFSANLHGGYLSPLTESNKDEHDIIIVDYLEQPVEAQANAVACLVSYIGGTGEDVIWRKHEENWRLRAKQAKKRLAPT